MKELNELRELKRLGATPQKNSGRGKFKKGDGVIEDVGIMVDVKEYAKSFAVSISNWAKVSTDALLQGFDPWLFIVLGEPGQPKTRLVVMTEDQALEYLELKRRYSGEIQD